MVPQGILIVGGSGHLGGWLVRLARTGGQAVTATFATHRPPGGDEVQWLPVDLRVPNQIAAAVDAVRPSVVINASPGGADWAVTADGAARVAIAARARGCRLVHVSSDAVFSGTSVRYDEDRLPDSITPYGAAKAAAETTIRALDPSAALARTSLIIGDGDSKHEEFVHALATKQRRGMLFTDDIRCPVYAGDLAAALLEVATGDHAGIVHLAGTDAVSRHEFGMLIARRDGYDPSNLPHGRRARTDAAALDVRLDGTRTQERLNTRLRGAREFLCAPSADGQSPRGNHTPAQMTSNAIGHGFAGFDGLDRSDAGAHTDVAPFRPVVSRRSPTARSAHRRSPHPVRRFPADVC